MSAAPSKPTWPVPPERGWIAADLDTLPDLPPHTELLDGNLTFMSPRANFHPMAVTLLNYRLLRARPKDFKVLREMTVTLGERDRPEPDVMVVRAKAVLGPQQTSYRPEDVVLAVEVVSPDSVERDRDVKPRKHAQAGIQHYWRVENENGAPVVHIFEHESTTRSYVPKAIQRDLLSVKVPFELEVDLTDLDDRA